MKLRSENKARLRETGLALVALVLIGGALALTFAHVLQSSPEDISGRYDIYRYYAPLTFYLDYCLSQGEFPLWNPLVYCGLPTGANPQAFTFYPLNLIRSLLLSTVSPQATNESLVFFIGLHLLFMGWWTYLLGRAHRLSFAASLVAALAWVCSALIVRRACEYHFLYTMTWLPLVLLFVKCAIDSADMRRRLMYCIAAGLVLGVSILGGFLQIVSYACVCLALYALLYRILQPGHLTGEPERPTVRGLSREVLAFGAIFLFAGLVSAALILPVAELAGFSARQKGMPVPMYSNMMAWDVTRLYQSLVVFPGMKYEAETLRGAGIIAILLAVAGCFHRNRRLVGLLVLLAYALIDCGFGPPFPLASVMHALTPFSPSAYSRGFDFALLPLGLLAGLGVDALWRDRGLRPARLLMTLILAYVGAATIIPMAIWAFPRGEYVPGVDRSVVVLPAVAFLAMLALLWTPRSRRAAILVTAVFPALLFAETWSWNRHYVPWMIKRQVRDAEPIKQTGHAFPDTNTRTTDPIANRALYSLTPVYNGVDPLHFADMRNLLSGTPRDKRSHRLVTEWEPTAENHRGNLFLKRYFWLTRYAVEGPLPGKQETFPPTTTAYLPDGAASAIPPPPDLGEIGSVSGDAIRVDILNAGPILDRQRSADQRLIQLRLTRPESVEGTSPGSAGARHATLVIQYRAEVAAQIDTRFVDSETNSRDWGKRHRVSRTGNRVETLEVPLPDEREMTAEISIRPEKNGKVELLDAYLMVDPADEDALIKIGDFSANGVTLEVGPLPGPRLLLFLDAWYPGWKAYVDGSEVFVLRANDVFKAVPISAGAHTVRFEFRPTSVILGVFTSIAGAVLGIGLLVWLGWRGREPLEPGMGKANTGGEDDAA